jgi:anti-sigma B factor antagonist
MQQDVKMDVRRVDPATAIVDIAGELTATAEPVLMAAFNEATEANARRIILNFTGLQYMNSTGIGLLVTLLVRANRSRQQLAAFGLTPHYRQIFELTRLDEAITIFDSEAASLAVAST